MTPLQAATAAIEAHPSTTFMAPCEDLARAAVEAAAPILLAELRAELAEANRQRRLAQNLERLAARCARAAEDHAARSAETEAKALADVASLERRLQERENQMGNAIDLCEAADESEADLDPRAFVAEIAEELKLHEFKRPNAPITWRDYTFEATNDGVAVLCRTDHDCMEAQMNETGRYLTLGEAYDWARGHIAWHAKMDEETTE